MAAARKKSAAKKAPWKKAAPKTAKHRSLTSAQKSSAKRAAKKAGRPYPNLVDNMRAATKKKSATKKSAAKKKSTARKASARKKSARTKTAGARKKSATKRKRPTRDPHGGLTAAGRREFARTEGAHLRPGVTKPEREMSPAEMRRKGSWAVRFYGRSGALPPLVGDDGEPTRFALTAAAWGEPVPRTTAAARRIAAKGRRLLARYERAKG